MIKKIITTILIIAFSFNIEAAYNSNKYMKVVDVQGNVKLEVETKNSTETQPSKKIIQKPARLGDLLFTRDTIITGTSSLTAYLQNRVLFTRDNIITGTSSLTAYLQNRVLFKIKENSSIRLDSTFDKNENIVFSLHKGEILIVAPMSYKPEYITVYTPDNSSINISGTAIVSYNGETARVQFLHGYGKLNGATVGQFTEVNVRDNTTSEIVMSDSLKNIINEILAMQYIDKVSQVNIYRDIARLNNSSFNVKQIITPLESEFLIQ